MILANGAWKRFWAWYRRHYVATLVVTTALFIFQGFHLYWLFTDVILKKLIGQSYFAFPHQGLLVYVAIDYLEIPTHLSMTLLYLYEFRQRVTPRNVVLFAFLQIHWIHILWITDDIVLQTISTHSVLTWATWVAWFAILIDYLELPIMADQLRKVYAERHVLWARIRGRLSDDERTPCTLAPAA